MNLLKFLISALVFVAIQANATTAVLCGNPELVDENDNNAIVHLIFDNPDSRSADEVRAFSKGKEIKIQSVAEVEQTVFIKLAANKGVLRLGSEYIDESTCENYSEDTFSMIHMGGSKKKVVESCRCFQD